MLMAAPPNMSPDVSATARQRRRSSCRTMAADSDALGASGFVAMAGAGIHGVKSPIVWRQFPPPSVPIPAENSENRGYNEVGQKSGFRRASVA